jgi:hypothetical protein
MSVGPNRATDGRIAQLQALFGLLSGQVAAIGGPPNTLVEANPAQLGPTFSDLNFLSVGTVLVRSGVLLVTAAVEVQNTVNPSIVSLQLVCSGGPPASTAFSDTLDVGETKTLTLSWIFNVTPGAMPKIGFNIVHQLGGGQITVAANKGSVTGIEQR